MNADVYIACDALDNDQAVKLEEHLKRTGLQSTREAPRSESYGDAILFSVIIAVTPALAGVIAAFLLRPRSARTASSSFKFRRIEPGGASTEYEITVTERELETKQLDDKSIKAIAQLTGLTGKQVHAALRAQLGANNP